MNYYAMSGSNECDNEKMREAFDNADYCASTCPMQDNFLSRMNNREKRLPEGYPTFNNDDLTNSK